MTGSTNDEEPFATVGVSQALLDRFFAEVFPRLRHPIVLVTSDYNSDRSAPQPFSRDHSAMLDHSRIAHWFSDNWLQPPPQTHPPDPPSNATHSSTDSKTDAAAGLEPKMEPTTTTTTTTTTTMTMHPKLTVMPIGINDRHVEGSHGDRRLLMRSALAMPPTSSRPPDEVYANFHHSARLGWWNRWVNWGNG